MRYNYILTKEINYADTWRDEDDIHVETLGIFSSKIKAKYYLITYMRENFYTVEDYIKELESIKFDEKGIWDLIILGSYAPTFRITKMKVD